MSDNAYKLYEVLIPVTGQMRIHLRAKDEQDAIESAGKIAIEMAKESSDSMIPNLFGWTLDRTVQPVVIERGEADD